MVTTDLTDDDLAILGRLAAGARTVARLAADSGLPADAIDDRLSRLADDGLAYEVGEAYAIAPSGRRALRARGDDPTGETGDVPGRVAREIAAFDLPPDAEDAVERAVTFLREWREATSSEVIDAVYAEAPAGWDDHGDWWRELVRDRLAALPGVVPPDDGDRWRYEGAEPADGTADGRRVLGTDDGERYGSAKHAIANLARSDAQADALSHAFALLFERGRATADDLESALGSQALASIEDRLAEIPGVDRVGEDAWRYSLDGEPGVDGSDGGP
ncbi:hypothetical protein [Halomarina pelagica]|uniref:hypothetical protein n=1 Tax=Halomarina pelagica TaxID=2961599 RepID=UPI0020C51A8F|nr:hypothetical protein [Halomarina sp. BND7]